MELQPRKARILESSGGIVPSRMLQLRSATQAAHARIELALPLLDAGLTLAGYRGVLRAMYGFYEPLEPLVERAAGAEGLAIALEQRGKTSLLATDLQILGDTPAELAAQPRAGALPILESASHAMGVLYVIEGATLGGQVIQRQLHRSLGIAATSGAAFFIGYGDRTRHMWRQLADHIDTMAGLEIDAAIDAARDTFERLERWLIASQAAP